MGQAKQRITQLFAGNKQVGLRVNFDGMSAEQKAALLDELKRAVAGALAKSVQEALSDALAKD